MLPEYSKEEAAAALSIMISFCDDDPSQEEAAVLREYYTTGTLDAVEKKLLASGQSFPEDLKKIKKGLAGLLQNTEKPFRLRTIAVCQKVALADGVQDQKEMNLINTFANILGITLYEAERYASSVLKAVDEAGGYEEDETALDALRELPEFSADEAGLLMAILAAFSDDNPSKEEVAVIREYYSSELLIAVRNKLESSGFEWSGKQEVMLPAIQKAIESAERSGQLKALAISWKTCNADGVIDPSEKEFLELFCRELGIGIVEVRDFFKTSVV